MAQNRHRLGQSSVFKSSVDGASGLPEDLCNRPDAEVSIIRKFREILYGTAYTLRHDFDLSKKPQVEALEMIVSRCFTD